MFFCKEKDGGDPVLSSFGPVSIQFWSSFMKLDLLPSSLQ